MYSVSFIFAIGEYDEAFYTLDKLIQDAAESLPGYVGKESWQSADGDKVNSIYYWEDKETVQTFSRHPKHIEAKRQYARWYKGYHIVVAKVERSYGDGYFSHVTPNERAENH